jgi:uncharacterized protein YdhG (YjbR/CyaY superfamily)
MKKVKSIAEYVKGFEKQELKNFQELRKIIHTVSKFEETVAYNMPAMRYKTKIVCCFAIAKNHLGLYPYSGNILKNFREEIKKKKLNFSSGALQLPKFGKLPKTLIAKIIKSRMREIEMVLNANYGKIK